MPRKSAALIGPGTGPQVSVPQGKSRCLQIRGLPEGEQFVFRRFLRGQMEEALHTLEDCEAFFFEECDFIQVEYNGKSRTFIACILIGG